jgi:hypothetical protein
LKQEAPTSNTKYKVGVVHERTGQPVVTSQNAKQLQNLVTGLIESVVAEDDDKE